MKLCKFDGCEDEAVYGKRGYCNRHYLAYSKGDKNQGIYVIFLKLKDGEYFYIGKAWKQPVEIEISKYFSKFRNYEKEYIPKDKKFKCFKRLREEHLDLTTDEVIERYVSSKILKSWQAGAPLRFTDEGNYEITDKEELKRVRLKHYMDFKDKFFTGNGLKKVINLNDMTNDEKEILRFHEYDYKINDDRESFYIKEYCKKYGSKYCLNEKKID